MAAKDNEGLQVVWFKEGANSGVVGGCADELTEAGAWVIHVGGLHWGVVVQEEDLGSGGTLREEEAEVVHCFPFGGEALEVWVGDMFGDDAVVVVIEVAFIDTSIGDAPCRVGEYVVAKG